MDTLRRELLKRTSAGALLAAAVAAGALRPSRALAAGNDRAAFEAKELAAALRGIGAEGATENGAITLRAPDIAENGAVVPVVVASTIAETVSIAVLVDKNPFPLSANIEFANGALPEVSLRLKMGETSPIRAVVRTADGKHYVTSKNVKVTLSGCG